MGNGSPAISLFTQNPDCVFVINNGMLYKYALTISMRGLERYKGYITSENNKRSEVWDEFAAEIGKVIHHVLKSEPEANWTDMTIRLVEVDTTLDMGGIWGGGSVSWD